MKDWLFKTRDDLRCPICGHIEEDIDIYKSAELPKECCSNCGAEFVYYIEEDLNNIMGIQIPQMAQFNNIKGYKVG